VRAAPYDPVRTLYRTILAFGAVGLLILTIGVVEFVHFEPYGQNSGTAANIVTVYAYDPATRTTSGPDHTTFGRNQTFAAVVDWSSLPPNITVDARWYDSFENVVGHVGPATPTDLGPTSTVPVSAAEGFLHNLPGHYIFVVERLEGGQPVEVLARRIVLVSRS
jgi:hypothetical protein